MANAAENKPRYGRSWKEWLLTYAAVALGAYLVIFLVLQAGGGSSPY